MRLSKYILSAGVLLASCHQRNFEQASKQASKAKEQSVTTSELVGGEFATDPVAKKHKCDILNYPPDNGGTLEINRCSTVDTSREGSKHYDQLYIKFNYWQNYGSPARGYDLGDGRDVQVTLNGQTEKVNFYCQANQGNKDYIKECLAIINNKPRGGFSNAEMKAIVTLPADFWKFARRDGALRGKMGLNVLNAWDIKIRTVRGAEFTKRIEEFNLESLIPARVH